MMVYNTGGVRRYPQEEPAIITRGVILPKETCSTSRKRREVVKLITTNHPRRHRCVVRDFRFDQIIAFSVTPRSALCVRISPYFLTDAPRRLHANKCKLKPSLVVIVVVVLKHGERWKLTLHTRAILWLDAQ